MVCDGSDYFQLWVMGILIFSVAVFLMLSWCDLMMCSVLRYDDEQSTLICCLIWDSFKKQTIRNASFCWRSMLGHYCAFVKMEIDFFSNISHNVDQTTKKHIRKKMYPVHLGSFVHKPFLWGLHFAQFNSPPPHLSNYYVSLPYLNVLILIINPIFITCCWTIKSRGCLVCNGKDKT